MMFDTSSDGALLGLKATLDRCSSFSDDTAPFHTAAMEIARVDHAHEYEPRKLIELFLRSLGDPYASCLNANALDLPWPSSGEPVFSALEGRLSTGLALEPPIFDDPADARNFVDTLRRWAGPTAAVFGSMVDRDQSTSGHSYFRGGSIDFGIAFFAKHEIGMIWLFGYD